MKVSNLLFAKYNNYPNRLVKTVLTDFASVKTDYSYLEVDDVNFHQGNGIAAEQVINADFEAFDFDYLFICDADDSYENVTSRWFVIGKEDLRRGQVKVSLKRDLISDYFTDVTTAKFMMERGNVDFGAVGAVADVRDPDPAVFAPEDTEYNQVKRSETLIYQTNNKEPSWIIGFCAKNIAGWQTVEIPELGDGVTLGKYWAIDFSDNSIENNVKDSFNFVAMPFSDCQINYTDGDGISHTLKQNKNVSLAIMSQLAAKGLFYDIQLIPYFTLNLFVNALGNIDALTGFFSNANTGEGIHCEPMSYGCFKGIYPGDAMAAHNSSSVTVEFPDDWPSGGTLTEVVFVTDEIYESVSVSGFLMDTKVFSLKNGRYVFKATEYSVSGTTITFSYPGTVDTLFQMMDAGKAHLELVYQYGSNPGAIQPVMTSGSTSRLSFMVDIDQAVLNGLDGGVVPLDEIKEINCLYKYRLVSPNRNGIFEWSPAMNWKIYSTDAVTYKFYCQPQRFYIGLDLKPFDTYFRICPDFEGSNLTNKHGGLYGGRWNDGRGLVCGGDFSLTMPSSAWANYKLNNKTFASSFGRELSTLDKQNQYKFVESYLGVITGSITGALAGAKAGGPYGAAAGAAVGLGAGAYNFAKTVDMMGEQANKMKSDFQMGIASIMAKPDSLTKIGAFDTDNRIWPILEIYSATDEEKMQFLRKMRMTGMAASKMTTIADQMAGTVVYPMTASDGNYYQFFSGYIAQIDESTGMTPEMIAAANDELRAGLYFALSNF